MQVGSAFDSPALGQHQHLPEAQVDAVAIFPANFACEFQREKERGYGNARSTIGEISPIALKMPGYDFSLFARLQFRANFS